MNFPAFYLLPLLAGFLYALGALLQKRAFSFEAGLMRSLFIANLMMGALFSPLFLLGETRLSGSEIGLAILVGLTFFLGQLFTFVAMRVGDVSLSTSILGTKVIFVAFFGWAFFGEFIPFSWWVGAFLTAFAIFLLSISDLAHFKHHLVGMAFAVLSSAFFGLTDAMLPVFARETNPLAFIATMFATVALLSLGLIPFFNAPLRKIPARAWPWLLTATAILATQSLLMAISLSVFGQATAVNILYSVRGLWALLLLLFLGRLLQSTEGLYGARTMTLRYAGALLLVIAVALVLLGADNPA